MDQPAVVPAKRQMLGGLLVRRERWGLSLGGKLLLAASIIGVLAFLLYRAHSFLAVTNPAQGEYLVVEGWITSPGLKQAKRLFEAGSYKKLLTSGTMAPDPATGEYNVTYADWAASKLRKLGMATNLMEPVPCWVRQKDRTYHSALAVSRYFQKQGITVKSIDLVSRGPHARRSQLLFQKAFGDKVKVGIIALPPDDYDTEHWWRSSEGVREVVGEGIAFLYARFLFTAD